jgi:phosphatidylglycerophosphate synthase
MASNVNPANAVTASRFLCLPIFLYEVDAGHAQIANLVALICGLLDLFDGWVARAFDCRTAFGEVFDGIADAICYGTMLIICAAYGWAPPLAVGLMIAMGLGNLWMRIIYSRRAGRTVNYRSYAMERLVAYGGYLIGIAAARFCVDYFFWLFTPLMAIVLIHDARRMLVDPVPA